MTERDEAAISELFGESSQIGAKPIHRSWVVPRSIGFDEERITWVPNADFRSVNVDPLMLERFLGLPHASDRAIVQFARRYGVLEICPHGTLASNHPSCGPAGFEDRLCYESFVHWRFYARHALALLKISAALLSGGMPDACDWQDVYARSGHRAPWWRRSVSAERVLLADCLTEMLGWGAPRIMAVWPKGLGSRPTLEIAPGGLYAAIALQVCLRAGRNDHWAKCSNCGVVYTPRHRKPKAGQRAFCPECRASGAPVRLARQDYLERKRHGKTSE